MAECATQAIFDAVIGQYTDSESALSGSLLALRLPGANPRAVKRNYTKWHAKRAAHRNWPQPNRTQDEAGVTQLNGAAITVGRFRGVGLCCG